MKKCYKCKELKPYESFNKYYMGKYGLSSKCKICTSSICNEYYKNNKKNILKNLKTVVICPDCMISYTKANKSNHLKTHKHTSKSNEIDNTILERLFNHNENTMT